MNYFQKLKDIAEKINQLIQNNSNKFKLSKFNYNNAENQLVVIGIWTVGNGSKVAMELHDTPESRIAASVRDGLHKAGYAGEIIIGYLPIGVVYFGMPAREISLEKISS
jgi:hypothetical protein